MEVISREQPSTMENKKAADSSSLKKIFEPYKDDIKAFNNHFSDVMRSDVKIIDEVAKYIFAIAILIRFATGLRVDIRIPIPFGAWLIHRLETSPHTELVESVFVQHIWLNSKVIDLPFAGDTCNVSGFFKDRCKTQMMLRIEMAPGSPTRYIPMVDPSCAKRVLTSQQRDSSWSTLRHRVKVLKLQSGFGKLIDIRSLN